MPLSGFFVSPVQNFNKVIDQFSRKHQVRSIFDDFLLMSVAAFTRGQMEKEYLECASRYDKNELALFGQMLGALVMDYDNATRDNGEWDDILGDWFMQHNSEASRMGQFFTPVSLCNLMARMSSDKIVNGIVNDCSAGSSRNLIAHARLNPQNRFNYTYVAQDLDRRCILMSVINYIMFGMKGVVIYMNTLSMQVYFGFRIYLPETGLGVLKLSEQECLNYITTKSDEPKQQTKGQQSLF